MVAANGVRLSSLTNCVSWECVRLQKIICADRRKFGVLVHAHALVAFIRLGKMSLESFKVAL